MSDILKSIENAREYQLDQSKFNLSVFQAQVDAEVDLLKARSEFLMKIQQVIAQQIKNEQELVRLAWMRLQASEYRLALTAAKRRLALAMRRQQKLETALHRLSWLGSGESLAANLVPLAWGGFFTLVANLSFDARFRLSSLPVEGSMRSGLAFAFPRKPDSQCDDAPESINNALALWHWARTKSYVPRSMSASQQLLANCLIDLARGGEEVLTAVRNETLLAEEMLRARREPLWKESAPKLKLPQLPPKPKTSRKRSTEPKTDLAADNEAESVTSSSSSSKGTKKEKR